MDGGRDRRCNRGHNWLDTRLTELRHAAWCTLQQTGDPLPFAFGVRSRQALPLTSELR